MQSLSYADDVDIRIGLVNTSRELSFESKLDADALEKAVADALANGGVLRLEDVKDSTYLISVAQLAYVQLGNESGRRVGFVA